MKTNFIKKKFGYTLFEVLIAGGIFTLLLFIIYPVFTYSRQANNTMYKLDVYHDVRRIDQAVFEELKLGSSIIYPPKQEFYSEEDWYHQLIFKNHLNQTIMLYVNKNDKFVLFNYDDVKGSNLSLGKILGAKIKDFSVRRVGSSVVDYKLTFEIEKKDFVITNRVTLVNVL